jgi:hypothetical protein
LIGMIRTLARASMDQRPALRLSAGPAMKQN